VDYNNKNIKFYKNGLLFHIAITGNNMLFPDRLSAKYVSSYNGGSGFSLQGYLDDVRIYNRGLSAEEISEIYNQTKGKY